VNTHVNTQVSVPTWTWTCFPESLSTQHQAKVLVRRVSIDPVIGGQRKVVSLVLPRSVGDLAQTAWQRAMRLERKGMPTVGPVMIACETLDPYTLCEITTFVEGKLRRGVGVSKRNPIDQRNLVVGVSIALYRAWRDLWLYPGDAVTQVATQYVPEHAKQSEQPVTLRWSVSPSGSIELPGGPQHASTGATG
jgi:hypothetical protein